MSPSEHQALLAALHADLRAARRRVHRAALRAAALRGAEHALAAAALAGGLFVVLRLGLLVAGVPSPRLGAVYLPTMGGLALLIFALRVLPALLAAPTWRQTAERLDLGTRDHNRVAVALALIDTAATGAFAEAAIHDGCAFAQRLRHARPAVEAGEWRRARWAALGAAVLGTSVLGLLCTPAGNVAGGVHSPAAQAAEPPDTSGAAAAQPEARTTRPLNALPPPATAPAAARLPGRDAQAGATGHEPGAHLATAGAAAPAQATSVAGQRTPAGAAGTLSSATGAPAAQRSQSKRTPPARPHARATPPPARTPEPGRDASSVSPGGSAGGAAAPVAHDWSQHEGAAERDSGPESDEPVEDEQRVSTQRGGLQPSLKDRQESPSRDLGMSGPQDGPPGSGRGGPTPPKKSRGTASLVLGVPVPDFVRGRIGPGTTKVVQERVAPLPLPGEPGPPAEARGRSQPEDPIPQVRVPFDLAAVVREYLLALHATSQRALSDAAAAALREE